MAIKILTTKILIELYSHLVGLSQTNIMACIQLIFFTNSYKKVINCNDSFFLLIIVCNTFSAYKIVIAVIRFLSNNNLYVLDIKFLIHKSTQATFKSGNLLVTLMISSQYFNKLPHHTTTCQHLFLAHNRSNKRAQSVGITCYSSNRVIPNIP